MSVCGASGLRKTASPCGWPSPLTSRASLPKSVSQDAIMLSTNMFSSDKWSCTADFHYKTITTHDPRTCEALCSSFLISVVFFTKMLGK